MHKTNPKNVVYLFFLTNAPTVFKRNKTTSSKGDDEFIWRAWDPVSKKQLQFVQKYYSKGLAGMKKSGNWRNNEYLHVSAGMSSPPEVGFHCACKSQSNKRISREVLVHQPVPAL